MFRFKAQFGKTHGEESTGFSNSLAPGSVRLESPTNRALLAPRPGPAVWLDLTDDDAAVPRFEGSIVSKVARLSFAASAGAQPLLPAAAGGHGASAGAQRGATTAVAPAPDPAPAQSSVPRASRGASSGKAAPYAGPSSFTAPAPVAPAGRSDGDAGSGDGNLDDIFGSDDTPAPDGSSTGRGTPGGAAAGANTSEHDGALDGLFDAPAVPAEPATRASSTPQQEDPMGGSRRRGPVPLAQSMARGGRSTPTGTMSGRGTPTSTAAPPRGGSSGPRNFSDLVSF